MEDIKILNPGQRLKQLRKILRVKQDELAGRKFSKNYISMFENNRRSINAINASYLAKKINDIAKQKGENINITASYLLKNEKDVAEDKCKKWLYEVESNLEISDYQAKLNIFKAIKIATKYNLLQFKGRALFLKAINSFNNKRYDCAITQFLDSIIYFAKENDFYAVKDVYRNIGITLYKQKKFEQAIIYFNLCNSIICKDITDNNNHEPFYYIALCYFKLGQHKIALKIIERCPIKNQKIKDLEEEINSFL